MVVGNSAAPAPAAGGFARSRSRGAETRVRAQGLGLNEAQREQVNATRRLGLVPKVIKEFNKKIMGMITFTVNLHVQNPVIFQNRNIDQFVRTIDPDTFCDDKESLLMATPSSGHKIYRDKDIVWENFHHDLPQLFITSPKEKYLWVKDPTTREMVKKETPDGIPKQKCYDVHRKTCQSFEYGCTLGKGLFPEGYAQEMEKFKTSLKKEKTEAKSKGEVEERDSDPISFELFKYLCVCATNAGDHLLWCMAVLQWNCIARCQNIDDLTMRNFTSQSNEDNICITFAKTKMDKLGKKISPKHIFANPLNWRVCAYTSLAVFFCIMNGIWSEDRKFIFINNGANVGSAASNYTDRISEWVKYHVDRIKQFIRPNRVNSHGLRKGPATHVTANTTCPPPLASIFHRAEWSLGSVLEIYWKYAQAGDNYLGRLLAGLDPNSETFAVLPPHFTVPMTNEKVQNAMTLCFGNIIKSEAINNPESTIYPLLYKILPSLVYHSDEIRAVIAECDGHPFSNINLFKEVQVLEELKNIVTLDPTPDVCSMPTGIPPHVHQMKIAKAIWSSLQEMKEMQKTMVDEIKVAVKQALEERDSDMGMVTKDGLERMFESLEKNLFHKVDALVKDLKGDNTTAAEGTPPATIPITENERRYYFYDGKHYIVPKGYHLPDKTQLFDAFDLYVRGNAGHCSIDEEEKLVSTPILPLAMWKGANLPKGNLFAKFKTGWQRVLKKMVEADYESKGLDELTQFIEENQGRNVSIQKVKEYYYDIGLQHLLDEVEYIKQMKGYDKWTVSTWSKRLLPGEIRKNGSEADKERLPPESYHNKKHSVKRTMSQSNRRVARLRRITTD